MDKKAQHSRTDMVVWYGLCLIVVVLAVGTLYSLDIIGGGYQGGQMTAAVVVEAEPVRDNLVEIEENSTIITEE